MTSVTILMICLYAHGGCMAGNYMNLTVYATWERCHEVLVAANRDEEPKARQRGSWTAHLKCETLKVMP